jgi:SAM-dependent methyltransferase
MVSCAGRVVLDRRWGLPGAVARGSLANPSRPGGRTIYEVDLAALSQGLDGSDERAAASVAGHRRSAALMGGHGVPPPEVFHDVAGAYRVGGIGNTVLEILDDARKYNLWVYSHIRPYLGAMNVELGAGTGTLTEIVARDFAVVPCELSEDNRQHLRGRFKDIATVCEPIGDIRAVDKPNSIDCVYSANVLEHIDDDIAVIEHGATILKPNGCFVAWVPAGMWLYSGFDRRIGHYRRYTRKDRSRLAKALTGCQTSIAEYRFLNPIGALGWFFRMKVSGKRAITDRDVRVMERLMPLVQILDKWPWPFGQSVLIVLRRNSVPSIG